jgi:hypothetical protein
MEPFIKLKDASLANYLLQLDGKGAKHPRQHDPVIGVPICSVIDLVSEDMIVEGVMM